MEIRRSYRKNRTVIMLLLAVIVLICAFFSSFFVGRYPIKPLRLVHLLAVAPTQWLDSPDSAVFYYMRLPRIILAIMIGASLSAAGSLFQGIFRNPLVSPDILGVSGGCCFGAALGIILGKYVSFPYMVPLMAFCFGIVAMLLSYGIASISRGEPVVMLVLAGMVVGSFAAAALSFLKFIADPYDELPTIVFWTMGGFYRAHWTIVKNLLFSVLPCTVLLLLFTWNVNILSLGDAEASSLGVNPRRLRMVLLIIGTFIVAACVSVTGCVGWVGLVTPHAARIIIGPDHRWSIPMAMLIGSSFLVLMDNIARSLIAAEIPISILTAAIGTPFFAYLLVRGRGNAWR